jgi:hypothetical protein
MTYTDTYTHPPLGRALHAPCTPHTLHAQMTYTQTYTAYTHQGPTRARGVLDTPCVRPKALTKIN